mmetsp:Transcript_55304/g.96461  ORF Transcript_55304/g.96461 Transcript_55304/m.96461 type:complete len:653 (-) Transcript_55304:63-2021(-)
MSLRYRKTSYRRPCARDSTELDMSLRFVNAALLNMLTAVAGSLVVEDVHGWLDQDSDVLNLLQLKVSKACPVPDIHSALPAKVAKSCPDPAGTGRPAHAMCIDGNRPYDTFSAAWTACGVTAGCGAVMHYPNGKFYLRRASDPDDPAHPNAEVYMYQCPGAPTAQTSAWPSVADFFKSRQKAEEGVADPQAVGAQADSQPKAADSSQISQAAADSAGDEQKAENRGNLQRDASFPTVQFQELPELQDGEPRAVAAEANQPQRQTGFSPTSQNAAGSLGGEPTSGEVQNAPRFLGVEPKAAWVAEPQLVGAGAEADLQRTLADMQSKSADSLQTLRSAVQSREGVAEPPESVAEAHPQPRPMYPSQTLENPVYFQELQPEAATTFAESQERAAQQPEAQCKEDGFTPLGQFQGGYMQMEQRFSRASQLVKTRELSFLEPEALNLHKQLVLDIEEKGVPGAFAETGVAKGGSALVLASMKNAQRCIHLYDTFEGIPEPSEHDGADVWDRYNKIKAGSAGSDYYGYMSNLEGFVQQQFVDAKLPPAESGIIFHKGLFEDTFRPTGLLAYVHLDGDWYESTRVVLERATPQLATNGIMILDDAYSWSGASDAVNDFFVTNVAQLKEQPFRSTIDITKDGKMFQIVKDTRLYIKRVE